MPRRGGRHFNVLEAAEDAMLAFRIEIADDVGLGEKLREVGWRGLATFEVGTIGGEMVKRIMIAGEMEVLNRYKAGQHMSPEIPADMMIHESGERAVTKYGQREKHWQITEKPEGQYSTKQVSPH